MTPKSSAAKMNPQTECGSDYDDRKYGPEEMIMRIGIPPSELHAQCATKEHDNRFGQLGTGSTNPVSRPAAVEFPPGVAAWIAVAGGGYHSLAVADNG